jgi:hypothetical protein
MGTGGILGAQALALKINQGFSEEFITPATGFSGLSLVNMSGVRLDGVQLTAAQANALNGQATLQIRDGADIALGGGPVAYGLSYGQLTDLIALLNSSFEGCVPSAFAQAHLYQPFVTSNAFTGERPATVSDFAAKPTYNTFSGQVVSAGQGCERDRLHGIPSRQHRAHRAWNVHLLHQSPTSSSRRGERRDHLQQHPGRRLSRPARQHPLRSPRRHGRQHRLRHDSNPGRLRPAVDGTVTPQRRNPGQRLRPAVTRANTKTTPVPKPWEGPARQALPVWPRETNS